MKARNKLYNFTYIITYLKQNMQTFSDKIQREITVIL